MSTSYINTAAGSFVDGGPGAWDMVVTKPTGIATHDVLIYLHAYATGTVGLPVIGAPSGFAKLTTVTAGVYTLEVWTKDATGSEPSTYSFQISTNDFGPLISQLMVYRGPKYDTLTYGSNGSYSTSGGGTFYDANCPGSGTVAGALNLQILFVNNGYSATPDTTTPDATTVRASGRSSGSGGYNGFVAIADRINGSADNWSGDSYNGSYYETIDSIGTFSLIFPPLITGGVGASAGSTTVAGIGGALKPAAGAVVATSSVVGVGGATTKGVGAAAGTASAAAASTGNVAKGAAAGTASASAAAAITSTAAGSAQGSAAVGALTGLRQAVGLAEGTSAVVYNDPLPILAPVSTAIDHVERAINRLCQYAKERRDA